MEKRSSPKKLTFKTFKKWSFQEDEVCCDSLAQGIKRIKRNK